MKQIYNATKNLLCKGLFVLVILVGLVTNTNAQQYANGPLSTGATSTNGTAAPAGFTWSEMNATNLNFGFGANIDASISIADNFTVPSGCGAWNVSKFTFYGYSSNYVGATSPFNRVFIKIFNTDPSVGNPTPVFGDFATNRFTASSTASIYRIANATPGTARQVWKVEANMSSLSLAPGNYWIEWALGTVAGVTSNFSPPVTILGQPSPAGSNAKQHDIALNAWSGVGATNDVGPQDMPFLIDYTISSAGSSATAPVISSVPSSTCAGSSITLSVIGGSLNGASEWKWYTISCGGTPVGTGNSITVSPAATTTYYARGEGGCAPGAGPCGQQTVTVTSCTCLSPDVATICEGTVQRLAVTPSGAVSSTFSSSASITIPSSGAATPYPSNITVSGLPASGAGVYVKSVTLNGLEHTWPSDIDILLQSPTGQNFVILSDAGGTSAISGVNLTISDAGTATVPTPIVTGTFKPTSPNSPDNFPAPGPGSVASITNGVLGTAFTGANPNGDWKLFVVDDTGGDLGAITGGWSITFDILPTAVWTQNPASPNSMFTNSIATIPYVAGTPVDAIWVKPATTTTYTATISAGPCAGDNNVTVTVLPRPTIAVTGAGCSPATLTATGGTSYQWSPATGLSSTSGATVSASTGVTTTYTVTGYAANGCSNTASATVNSAPTASVITAPPAFTTLLTEGFDAVPLPAGWVQQNLSSPAGVPPFNDWYQGTTGGTFTSHSGADFRGCAFLSGSGTATLSNWLFSPQVTIQNGDEIVFWAIAANAGFADRLQLRFSSNGTSVNAGATATSVGDFTTLLLDINPTYNSTAFPAVWTRYTATVSGLSGPATGKLAFRYFVENGGPNGANSDNIGLDDVEVRRPLAGVCANTVSTFNVNITGGISPYTLVYSNGTTNTTYGNYTSGTPIQVSPSVTTNYTIVSVTGANGCAGTGNTGIATINVVPAPAITAQPQSVSACDAGNASFSVTTTPLNNTYQWQVSTNGGGSYSNLANGGVYAGVTTSTLTLTGVTTTMSGYRYRVVVNGQCPPPVTSAGAILTVNVAPTITAQPANITRCAGASGSFSVTATGNSPTYQWQVSTNGGGTYTNIAGATSATLALPGVTTSMSGNLYRVVVTVAPCGTTATSSAASLTVNALPVVTLANADPSITPGQTTTITATSIPAAQTATSWSWTLNGSPVSPAVTGNVLTATIDRLGTYHARVTDVNGCSAESAGSVTITGEASDRLWIYPNPSSGQFQVRLYSSGNPTEKRIVAVYNSAGARIVEKVFVLTDANGPYLRMDFDLSGQAAGIYVVKVEDRFSDKITSGLVVISH